MRVERLERGAFVDELGGLEAWTFSICPLAAKAVRFGLIAFDAALDADPAAFASWGFDHGRRRETQCWMMNAG